MDFRNGSIVTTTKEFVMEISQQTTNQPLTDWCKVSEALAYSGYSRSWLYRAMDSGDIESRSLVRKGLSRGKRLIKKSSLDAFLSGGEGKVGNTNGTN